MFFRNRRRTNSISPVEACESRLLLTGAVYPQPLIALQSGAEFSAESDVAPADISASDYAGTWKMNGWDLILELKGKESAPKVTGTWADDQGGVFKFKGKVVGLGLTMTANTKAIPTGETEKAKIKMEISVSLNFEEEFRGWGNLTVNKKNLGQFPVSGEKQP